MRLNQLKINEVEQFPFPDDWDLNNTILEDTTTSFLKDVDVNYGYDIPYVAGYSVDGKTVYIDRDLPKNYTQTDGKVVTIEKFLVLHECVEKALLMRYHELVYQMAHQLALRLELAAVKGAGVDEAQYNAFFAKWIKKDGDERIVEAPANLDLTPYKDEKDQKTIQALKSAMK